MFSQQISEIRPSTLYSGNLYTQELTFIQVCGFYKDISKAGLTSVDFQLVPKEKANTRIVYTACICISTMFIAHWNNRPSLKI